MVGVTCMSRSLPDPNSMTRKIVPRYDGGRSTVRAPRSSAPVSSAGVESVIHTSAVSTPGRGLRLLPVGIVYADDRPAVVVVARYYSANVERHESPPLV